MYRRGFPKTCVRRKVEKFRLEFAINRQKNIQRMNAAPVGITYTSCIIQRTY